MNCFRSADADASTGCGIGEEGEAMFTISKSHSHAVAQPIAFSGQMSNPQTDVDMTQTLQAKNPMAVAVGAFNPGQSASAHSIGYESEMAPTLEANEGGNNKPAVHIGMAVRRLTPVECERLQGFPDNYTDIKHKGKPTPDGPRYKALGNSMAVPVMHWIGKRIAAVDQIIKGEKV
jgi:DNA (cytosine-5)-methyltransferase 1